MFLPGHHLSTDDKDVVRLGTGLIGTIAALVIFGSFGLFAKPSATVFGSLFVFALSAAGAIYLVLELGQPFAGLMQISSAPLRNVLTPLSP